MRLPAKPRGARDAKRITFPAPTGGWVANRNLAKPNQYGQQPGAALLENWFPLATAAIVRRGSELYATLGDGSVQVDSLFSYVNGAVKKLFGTDATRIYDLTTIVSAQNYTLVTDTGDTLVTDTGDTFGENSTIGLEANPYSILLRNGTDFLLKRNDTDTLALGHALTSTGAWSVVQFATPGGVFLRGVNGSDTPFVFDGTSWSTLPALTFSDGTTPEQMLNVWVSKNRLWFVKKDSLDAYYLAADSIGGAMNAFPLGGVFGRGGSLLFGASWSIETFGGLAEHAVFVTTEGEVAVYQGTDPSDAANWSLVGVYRIGRPLGPKAVIRAGGDLVIATDIGAVPLSQAMQRDYAALSPSAVSYAIETEWNDTVEARSGSNWNCEVWPTNQMVLVAPPTVNGESPEMFVANARTGAWAKFTGWDATCLCLYDQRMFFGSQDGQVIEANVTGADQGLPYTATYVPLFDDGRTPASLKTAKMARATLREGIPVTEQVSVSFDFDTSAPSAPDATPVLNTSAWGTGIWGQSVWGNAISLSTQQKWQSVGGEGYTLAPCVQITSGSVVPLDTQIVRVDVTYDVADVVT